MTVDQALNMIAPVRLVISGRQVIFNTWDQEEAKYWSAQGANVRAFYAENAVRFNDKVKQGWEVSLLGACDTILVEKLNGKMEDITSVELAKQARARRTEAGV